MKNRPDLSITMNREALTQYYYLKTELIAFCRTHALQTTGNKQELINRIALFLETGQKSSVQRKRVKPAAKIIHLDELIGTNFVCTQAHRAFYQEHIGKQFHFFVAFQKWLKNNPDKTYRDSIQAYYQLLTEKKQRITVIEPQFEYNAYIRAFFQDNQDKTLSQAITCWNYKKSAEGSHQYEASDLIALTQNTKKG